MIILRIPLISIKQTGGGLIGTFPQQVVTTSADELEDILARNLSTQAQMVRLLGLRAYMHCRG